MVRCTVSKGSKSHSFGCVEESVAVEAMTLIGISAIVYALFF